MQSPMQSAKLIYRSPYAWPGGYPMYLLLTDGAALCKACVRSEWRQIAQSHIDYKDTPRQTDGWTPAAAAINWEDAELSCDHCGELIESAYGDVS